MFFNFQLVILIATIFNEKSLADSKNEHHDECKYSSFEPEIELFNGPNNVTFTNQQNWIVLLF